ncbi:hypothetical protein G7048_15690 [Diaphorobacter sp. HDW4B]|uniref:hypothetical protein n=1 Tax=Diaphorobacter sp. HDW4B TaxID=2714925 RepID=UPI00140C4F2D|nr:hypothetical protein [Diaphorobacter sp. HDW4B]QIL71670.1 hypothetical protein G7048_15690 [Diaphorobacter sp. HDW4B]
MALNIKSKAVAATSFLHLKDSSDNLMWDDEAKTLPVGVTIYGPGSKEFQQAQVKVNNRAVKRLQKRGNTDQTADVKLKEQAEYLADITAGFQNLDYDGLQGRQLAMAIYSDPSIGFIGDQVAEHVKDWANFSQASATA